MEAVIWLEDYLDEWVREKTPAERRKRWASPQQISSRRKFANVLGLNPYVAKRLITDTERPLSEVAFAAGFSERVVSRIVAE